jgi:hypothetical protein
MRLLVATLLFAGAALIGCPPVAADAPAVPLDASSNALYRRMVALNAALRTYKATIHLDIELKTFPFLSPSLDGTAYYKKPDKEAVVFDTVPALASQFKKVYPRIDPPSEWPANYDASILGDADGATKVDDANATIASYTWTYKDGGSVSFDQSYKSVGGNFLVDKQTGHVDLPSYKADVTSQFSNYQINIGVADSVFEEN